MNRLHVCMLMYEYVSNEFKVWTWPYWEALGASDCIYPIGSWHQIWGRGKRWWLFLGHTCFHISTWSGVSEQKALTSGLKDDWINIPWSLYSCTAPGRLSNLPFPDPFAYILKITDLDLLEQRSFPVPFSLSLLDVPTVLYKLWYS